MLEQCKQEDQQYPFRNEQKQDKNPSLSSTNIEVTKTEQIHRNYSPNKSNSPKNSVHSEWKEVEEQESQWGKWEGRAKIPQEPSDPSISQNQSTPTQFNHLGHQKFSNWLMISLSRLNSIHHPSSVSAKRGPSSST